VKKGAAQKTWKRRKKRATMAENFAQRVALLLVLASVAASGVYYFFATAPEAALYVH
jgi:hypothetical protein